MQEKIRRLNEQWTDIYFYLHVTHHEKITHQMVRMLQLIDKKEDIKVQDVASFLTVSPNTASEHVKRAMEKGYLTKRKNLADERKTILEITDIGKQVLSDNTKLDELKLKRVLDRLGTEDKELVERAFTLLSKEAKRCL